MLSHQDKRRRDQRADVACSLKNIQTTKNVKELQTLLGLITDLNRFAAKLAKLTTMLRGFTEKHTHLAWYDHHQEVLDKIK